MKVKDLFPILDRYANHDLNDFSIEITPSNDFKEMVFKVELYF